jgi:hypothetical protein
VQKIKKALSVFLLLVFLFPFVEKELHQLSHSNDIHCLLTGTHFDPQEHRCTVCDFTNHVTAPPAFFQYDLFLGTVSDVHFFFVANDIVLQKQVFRPLRAPPGVV